MSELWDLHLKSVLALQSHTLNECKMLAIFTYGSFVLYILTECFKLKPAHNYPEHFS